MRFLFWRKRREAELSEEIQSHLEMAVRDRMERGEETGQAKVAAYREFGNAALVHEVTHDQWGWMRLEDLVQDLRFGLRMLRKSPGFTTVAVLTLALGIGANTAIFSVINAVLLRNLPVENPEQLVFLTNPDDAEGMAVGFGDGDRRFLTYPEFRELERSNDVFSGLVAATSFTAALPVEIAGGDEGREPVPGRVSLVSGSYFSVLGVRPVLGRVFTTEVENVRDANPVAVISYRFWQDRFASSPAVVDRKVRIHDTSFDIVGVAPPQFQGQTVGVSTEIWIPLSMQAEVFPGRDYLSLEANPFHKVEWLQAIGRLKPGVSIAQAKAGINVAFQQIMASQTGGMTADQKRDFLNQHLAVVEGSRGASTLRESFGKPLKILMAIVGLILLIACANVANILLARSAARKREITVRVAMGAGSSRLFRQVFTESILLSLIGGIVGLVFAYWADGALLRMVSSGPTPIPLDVRPDAKVLLFTLGVSLFTGILFGLAPAFRAARVDLSSVLKATSRTTKGGSHLGRVPVGKSLVVAQVGLSLLLLVIAGLFVRSFQRLAEVKLGYDRDHVLTFGINPLSYGYKGAAIGQLYKDILARLDAIPGVRSASLIDNDLFAGTDSNDSVTIEGQKPKSDDDAESRWDLVGPNFFSAAGIPILYGRGIGPEDSGNGQRVGVINEEFARYFFGDSDPIGKRVHVETTEALAHTDFVIVGVAANAKQHSVREKPQRRFYVPFFNPIGEATYASIIVRTSGDTSTVASAIRVAVRQTAANLPPVEIESMKQVVAETLATDRMITQLASVFGVLAIVLVCIGLYGIMSYAVSGRISEIGIRIALGAQRADVLWMILRESLLLVFIGVAIGLPVVFGAGKWISSLLFDVKPADPTALAFATGLLFVVGSLACYIPARRAMRVDPMVALRYE